MKNAAFTLPELLIAVSIFAIVSTIIAGLYINSFRSNRTTTEHNRIYEDARFIMNRIANEIRAGMVDYDEYFNQYVVVPTGSSVPSWQAPAVTVGNYGQNYGRYFSTFFNPGVDEALGFDCNNAPGGESRYDRNSANANAPNTRNSRRNKKDCVPLRRTIDRHTGQNPFIGKYERARADDENAFCANIAYTNTPRRAINPPNATNSETCNGDFPKALRDIRHSELYLISQDGRTKTILARERIGGSAPNFSYALALLRMKGLDCVNRDGVFDRFECTDEFQCTDATNTTSPCALAPANTANSCAPTVRPLPLRSDLTDITSTACDYASNGFSRDFVPVSPLTVNVSRLNFIITPAENPHYAFSEESARQQPRVTVVLTIEPNPSVAMSRDTFAPITLIETVSPGVLTRISAPVLVVP